MKLAVNTLAFCVAALLALGLVMLYSSSMTQVGTRYLVMQSIWCVLGLTACVIAAALDYRLLKKFAWPMYVVALLLLAMVLERHIGTVRGNARRWFSFGGVSFQPSEFAKLALIVMLAWYGERYQRQMHTWVRGIVVPGLLILPILLLIFVEPDRGTTILLAAIGATLLLISGVQWKYFLPPIMAGLIANLNAHQVYRGRPILGYVNPVLYNIYRQHPLAFNDMTWGNSSCTEYGCCSSEYGFTAIPKWDAVGGLGTPNIDEIKKYLP